MAEAVVDMKSMEKLPYDPDTIPPAVRKRAEAVNALYSSTALSTGTVTDQQINGSGADTRQAAPEAPKPPQPVPEVTSAPQEPVATAVSSPTPAPSAPAEPSPPPPEVEPDWKRQALTWEGRYKATAKMIAEQQEQMTQLGNELLHAQRLLQSRSTQQPAPPPPSTSYLTEQDEQNYGRELLDVTQRAALQAVAPKLQNLEQQNAELQRRLAVEAKRALDQAVELAVPNYREIDRNPRWHNWLLGIDLYTGRVRQQLLDEAITAASAPRVISFFRGFLAEEVATGNMEPASGSPQAAPSREPAIPLASLAAPGRARPATGGDTSLPPDKPTYTHANIRDLYSARRKGAYTGRDAEWNRIEADIFAAQREGRVR